VSMEFCCVSYLDFLHNNLLFYTRVVPSLHIFSRLRPASSDVSYDVLLLACL